MKRRILATLMVLSMVLSLFPVALATRDAGESGAVSGRLTHRGLDGDGEHWWIGDDFLYEGIGQVPPGSEHWLAFYAGETEQPVEVTVTQGEEYVEALEQLPDGSNYYFIKIARGSWDGEITLSSTDGAWSDTFSIGRDHAAFYKEAEPTRENYLYDFTLTQENTSMYLQIEEPEGFSLTGIQTHWYDEETGDSGPHNGWEPAWYDDLGNGLYRINFDPIYAAQCYGQDDFDLFLEVLYHEGEFEHAWGASIRILNDVNVLTHKGLDNNGENWWVRDESLNWGIGRVAPDSEHWLVFYPGYHEDAVEVEVTQGGDYVTLDRIGNQEEPYYYIKVNEDCWGKTVTLSATVDGETWSDTFVLDRNHADFFSEPGSDPNTHLNYFQLSDTNTTLYLHIDPPEWADSYDIRTEWYDEERDESGLLEGCDVVEIERVEGQNDVFAITFDPQAVPRNYGHDDFGLTLDICYREVMEDGETREEIWGTGIHIANQLPFLQYLWLDNHGEGWFVNDWENWSDGFSIRPGDVFYHTYFLTYYNNGEPVTKPVIPTPADGRLIVKKLATLEDEPIWEGEEYADYFVQVFSEEDKWDEEDSLSAAVDGHTASITVPICRGQAEFYETTVPGNDTVLMEVDKEKNPVFYLGFQREPGWHVEEVYVKDDSLATLEDLGIDASEKYFLFQVTLTEKGIRIAEDFQLDVEYQWVNDEDENDRHHNGCSIYVPAVWPEDFKATFKIDSHDVEYYAIDDQGGTLAYVWEWDDALDCPVLTPKNETFPIRYNYLTNTITLALEETGDVLETLELVYEDDEGNQLLPSKDMTLAVEGENIIWNGTYDPAGDPNRVSYSPALRLDGGINLTITGGEGDSLLVHSENDESDPWTHAAIDLWNNQGGSITFAGDARYTVTVGGESYEVDEENTNFNNETGQWETTYIYEDGQKIPANFHAIGAEYDGGVKLVVQDNAQLTVLPGEGQARWHGLEGLQNLEVVDHAVLNTSRINMAENEDAKLAVRGDAQLNVTMATQDEGYERYYHGIAVPNGKFVLQERGEINITAPELDVTEGRIGAEGLTMDSGVFEVRDGTLNIDLTGIRIPAKNTADSWGHGLSLGDSESDRSLVVAQNSGIIDIQSGYGMTAMRVGANTTADLSGGELNAQAWQGVMNQGVINLRDRVNVTLEPWTANGEVQRTCENGLFYNDIHYMWRQVSALNVYGGSLNVTAFANPALISATEYIQTGGFVTLTDQAKGGGQEDVFAPAVNFGGRNTLSGGQMTVFGISGLLIYPESAMMQNYFRLSGTDLTVFCDQNGVLVAGDQDRIATMNLMGGKLTINQAAPENGLENSALVLDGGGLTVSGGQHTINGYTGEAEGSANGLRAYQSPGVKINGGTLSVSGHRAVVAESVQDNPFAFGSGMYFHSNNDLATGLTFVESDPQGEGEIFEGLTRYTLRETIDGQQVDAASVTFEAGEEPPAPPAIETTAQIETTTARATVGAMVTIQANVTAENGTVTFRLPEGLEFMEGSITVNNMDYDGDLSAIPVEGSAHIVFRVIPREKPTEDDPFVIRCTVNDGSEAPVTAEGSFTVYSFDVSAPSHTINPCVVVQGSAVPNETIVLTVKNLTKAENKPKVYEPAVTEMGTFGIEVDLPMAEEDRDAEQKFEITLSMKEQEDVVCSVTYTPNYPSVNDMSVGNQIPNEYDQPEWNYFYIHFENGTGTPERNFYTYVPEMDDFRFETEFQVPEGWGVENPRVEIAYQDGMEIKTLEITMTKTPDGDDSSPRYTAEELDLPSPPMDFRVGYEVVPPYEDPNNPGMTVSVYTNTVVAYPIIDPAGIIYSGSLDNPVADAEVTLYYGGNGQKPGEAQFFDMTPYRQVNPQITDGSGHYRWDVPTGWWKVVAEKNGFYAESQWVHVLPAHTDLHLNLNLPSDEDGPFDLVSIKPHTANGIIPAKDFQADITLTNFDGNPDGTAQLMVATYGENGQFLSFQPKTISGLEQGKTTTVQINVSNPEGKAKRIKVFLVDSFITMEPLSTSAEFNNT